MARKKARRRPKGLGSVFAHGRLWWIAYPDERGERVRIPGGFDGKGAVTKTEAEEKLKDLLAARHTGVAVNATAQRKTVDKYLDDYEADLKTRGKKPLRGLGPVREAFGSLRPSEVSPETLSTYRERMAKAGSKPATINRGLQALRAALRLAWKAGTLARAPYVAMKSEKGNARSGFFEYAEHLAITAHLPEPYADFAEFGYRTGWRLNEICGLRWADVDEASVRIPDSKNGEGRVFPLSYVRDVIARREAARVYDGRDGRAESEWVFHRRGFRCLKFDLAWDTARKAAGFPTRLFHDYRRTAVRDLMRSGVQQATAMKWTGHKSDAVFRRYNITTVEDLEQAAGKLSAYRDQRAAAIGAGAADAVVNSP